MANPSKKRGTAFETLFVAWMRDRLGDTRIERRAPHGSVDLGDVYGLYAHGSTGIAELKDYRSWGLHDLDRWKRETLAERDNAGADWGLLVPKKYGFGEKTLGNLPVHVTYGDSLKVANISHVPNPFSEWAGGTWVSTTLEEFCRWMEGPDGA